MQTTSSEFCTVCARELASTLETHCTSCELADEPIEFISCLELPRQRVPWWELLGIRWPIPVCLTCPPDALLDRLTIVINELTQPGVVARVIDERGRVVASAKMGNGPLTLEFVARRDTHYSLNVRFAKPTLLDAVPQVELLGGGKPIQLGVPQAQDK